MRLIQSEAKDALYQEKVYEALIASHVDDFNAEMKVWRSGQLQDNDTFTLDDLLSKAREHYHSLVTRDMWPRLRHKRDGSNDKDDESRRRKRRKQPRNKDDGGPTDIAALVSGLIKAQEEQTKALTASFSSSSKSKFKNNDYSYDNHYGPGKQFHARHEFMQWVHTKPTRGTTKTIHGIKWTWCDHCEKMGYHSTESCNSKRAMQARTKARKKPHANVAKATKKSIQDSSSEGEYEFSDTDDEPSSTEYSK